MLASLPPPFFASDDGAENLQLARQPFASPPPCTAAPAARLASLLLASLSRALLNYAKEKRAARGPDWVTGSTGHLRAIHSGVDGALPFSSSSRGNKGSVHPGCPRVVSLLAGLTSSRLTRLQHLTFYCNRR